ncbi:MAG: Protein phosphatase 2C 1 [Vezdaea aestivalis]|nr:MAG: Protein phosphatase 2C 1 [Vezdaea aestivalis]
MFGGSSGTKEEAPIEESGPGPSTTVDRDISEDSSGTSEKVGRRNSAANKASAILSSAKNSLLHGAHGSSSSPTKEQVPQSPLQKLGKADPALSVPQGSNNNSAGESHPGSHSTFYVGVTEDKNKKCRKTMEDTHAYLYNFLSTPLPTVDSKGRTSIDSESHASTSGASGRNPSMVETDNGYFAIFDGHAGSFAADWCGKKLHLLLEELIRKHPNTPLPELLDQTFMAADAELEKLPLKNSGCTAITAVLRWEDRIPNPQSATGSTGLAPATAAAVRSIVEARHSEDNSESRSDSTSSRKMSTSQLKTEAGATAIAPPLTSTPSSAQVKLTEAASRQRVLYTANVGDARIVLCRNGKALRLSYDHKGSDENEGKRVSSAGGLILNNRVNGVLAVTRALGDTYMKDLVTGHPYTTETVIQPEADEFVILACDGLWDVCSDQEAVDLVRATADPQLASKMLVDHALARFSTDNLSCMIVRLDSAAVSRQPEPMGVEGDPASKRGDVSEAEAIVAEAKAKIGGGEGPVGVEEMQRVVEEGLGGGEPGPELTPGGAVGVPATGRK